MWTFYLMVQSSTEYPGQRLDQIEDYIRRCFAAEERRKPIRTTICSLDDFVQDAREISSDPEVDGETLRAQLHTDAVSRGFIFYPSKEGAEEAAKAKAQEIEQIFDRIFGKAAS